MTHDEQRLWLIQQLLAENPAFRQYPTPSDANEQKKLLRALMNVREPAPIGEEFLQIQNEYLTEENRRQGTTDVADLAPSKLDPRLALWQGDITTLKVDAIVNAANKKMLGCFTPLHACVDNIIGSKAGIRLRLRCHEIMQAQGCDEPTGGAKITPGFCLPSRYILHTVGPIVSGRLTREHEAQLAACYAACLNLAAENGLASLAFCCVSTGVFMFPNRRAAEIAVQTVRQWLDENACPMKIVFNVYKDEDWTIYSSLLG